MRRADAARLFDHDAAARPNADVRLMVERLAAILTDDTAPATLRSMRRQFEREYVALVLRRYRGRVGEAARALGIQRTNLYRKARQLGIPMRREATRTVPGQD